MKILIFDNDSAIGHLLLSFLQRKGHQVEFYREPDDCSVYSGNGCTCQKTSPCAEAILLDNGLPNHPGIELLRRQEHMGCKLDNGNKAIMSARMTATEVDQLRAKGLQIISKPFHLEKISEFIDACQRRIDKGEAFHSN